MVQGFLQVTPPAAGSVQQSYSIHPHPLLLLIYTAFVPALAIGLITAFVPQQAFLATPPAAGYTIFAVNNAGWDLTAALLGVPGGGQTLLTHPLLQLVIETHLSVLSITKAPTQLFQGEWVGCCHPCVNHQCWWHPCHSIYSILV